MFKLQSSYISSQLADEPAAPQGIIKNNGTFICMTCGKNFNDGSNARKHYKTKHLPVTPAKCHVCHRMFKNAVSRNSHRAKEHGITERMMRLSRQNISLPNPIPEIPPPLAESHWE